MPKVSRTEILIREACECSGRTDPDLLKRLLKGAKGLVRLMEPREGAIDVMMDEGLCLAEGDGPLVILPSGVDPVLVSAIMGMDEQILDLKKRIACIEGALSGMMETAIGKRLAEEGRRVPEEIDASGPHPCDGSPTGLCCYDPDEDPSFDHRLFCGAPEERK